MRKTPDETPFWQSIDLVLAIVNDFINKINESPEYYLFIRHIQDKDIPDEKLLRSANIKNKDKAIEWVKRSYEEDGAMFPPDTGFLRTNEITNQLNEVKNLLDCYKRSSVSKIKLVYM